MALEVFNQPTDGDVADDEGQKEADEERRKRKIRWWVFDDLEKFNQPAACDDGE